MASGKARYRRPQTLAEKIKSGQDEQVRDFSSQLLETLRKFCPHGSDGDQFTDEILVEASWAISELDDLGFSLTRADCRAEQLRLRGALEKTSAQLRNLSADFDALLDADADPLGCADAIDELIEHVDEAGRRIDSLTPKAKPNEVRHAIGLEMAIRVLRVAEQHGMKISASGSAEFRKYISDAPLLLKAIGDDIGLKFEALTWRNIVAEAKKAGD